MDVNEVTEKLPWLQVTSSSDSESESGELDGLGEERKLKQKWGCIRQASLLTLKERLQKSLQIGHFLKLKKK